MHFDANHFYIALFRTTGTVADRVYAVHMRVKEQEVSLKDT